MVNGIEKFKEFKEFFEEYKEQYILIGGAACDIILAESEVDFRATKDLDLVLIVEMLTPEFGKAFWQFIISGGYRNKSKSVGTPQFYRFDKPEIEDYPYMLELFSREIFELEEPDGMLTPVHFSDEVSSLSAILLNESYYAMLLKGRTEINHIVVLAPTYIIPFKAKAWLDLIEKKKLGIHVDDKAIKKHKNDIVRLITVLQADEKVELPKEVKEDMRHFIENYKDVPVDLKSLRINGITSEVIVSRMEEIYL